MTSRKIIILSNKNYEFQAKNLIESLILQIDHTTPIIYYTIGFESRLDYPNLICQYFEPIKEYGTDFYFYKPAVLYHALDHFGGDFLFMDCDILVGKRFNIDYFKNDEDYPLLTTISHSFPIIFGPHYSNAKIWNPTLKYIGSDGLERLAVEVDIDGRVTGTPGTIIYNEAALMRYVGTCVISFGEKCEDFILEWKSLIENPWIRRRGKEYLPFHEETAMNIILWRRGVEKNYETIFVNTHKSEILEKVEMNSNILDTYLEDDGYTYCRNSNEVLFYHGFKDRNESQKALEFLKQNKL